MKNTKHLQANTMLKGILSILFLLVPFILLAQEQPKLVAPDVTVKAGQPFEVSVQDAPAGSEIQWTWDSRLKCTKTSSHILSCTLERPFLTEESLNVEVGATIDKLKWSGTGVVTIDKTGGRKPKITWEAGVSDVGKLEKINGLLKELQSGELSEARILDFYNKMGVEKLSIKDLIEFKDSVIKGKHKELGYYKHGVDFWNQNFRPMEMQIMNVRKEMVLKAWDATIKQYFRDNPEGCKIYKMDVGGWVKETVEKMKFEGDIDFTIIMERSEDAILIRNIFEGEIQKIFNLDMVAVDALATAHRAATLSVYIGEYGADWAEKDAIKRGKMQAIEYEDGRIVIREEVPPTEKQTIFSILKNNEGMRRGQPDMLAQIKQEKADPKPTYNMEPGISLEFLRHVTEDAIHQRLAPHEKLIRICKYLDRSAKEHASIMETFGVKPQPINPALIKASADIIAVKQDPKLNPEETYLKIMLIGESLMGSAWLNDPEAFLQKLGERAAEVMKHNIEVALEQRLKKIEGAKDIQEKDAEKRKLLDELENEFKAFSEGNVEFPPKAKSVMIELATYFKNRGLAFKLSPEEQKRIAELLKRLTDNPKASRTWVAMIWQHIQTLHAGADTAINEMNNVLDVLDNHTIEKLRMTEGIEFEVGGKKIKPMNIKAVNEYLNGTVLGTIGNNTSYKGINLAMETKAYWDAVMNAETWSEGFKNLGYEVMTRRLPGYALTETFMMGNYGRMSLELVYLFCPLTAVPEGLYGMAQGAAEWGVGKMNQWRYEELVEALYNSATFEKYGEKDQFKEWRMTGFTYNCPPVISLEIDAKTKSKEGLFDLLNSCKKVSVILYSQIKNHPAIVQFEEMLGNPAVSSGKASIMGVGTGWPYQYAGLSKYGEELYKIYRKKIDDVTLEYFKGVIDGLEKRKSWEVGTGYAKIIEIEKELGCTKPLMEYTKGVSITGHVLGGDSLREDLKNDAKRFQEVVDTYNKLKESNKAIAGLKERWRAEFLEGLKPECTPASIKETGKRASELAGRLTKAVEEAKTYVDKVIGKDAKEKDFGLITKARLCMAYYSFLKGNSSSEYSRCYEDYQQAKAEVDKKAVNVVMAELDLPKVEFCVGEKVTPAVSYNKPCDECRVVAWEILDDQGRVEERPQPGTKTTWKPSSAGDKTIRAKVEIEFVKDFVKFERTPEKKVSVKPEDQCPKLKIALDSEGITEIGKDSQITVTAKPLSLAPGSPPVKRYFWTEDGQERPSSETPDYIVSGKGKGNRSMTLEAVARDADGNLSEKTAITIRITDQATASLLVKIMPVDMEMEKDGTIIIKDNESVTFKSVVSTKIPLSKKESGELIFRWSADKTTVFGEDKNTATFKGEGWSGKKVKIDVVVMDAKKREGTASIIVDVKASKGLTVIFEDHPKVVTERDVLKLRVLEPIKTTGNYRYTWKRNGAVVRDKMEPDYFDISDFQGLAGKSVTFVVEVSDDAGRTGKAETTISVTEPKPEVETLKVSVKPESSKIKEDEYVDLTCSVEPFKDSGKLSYYWAEYPEATEKTSFRVYGKDTKYKPPVTTTVTVRVKDEKSREGEATASVYVEAKTAKDEPGKKWDDAISSASKDWKQLVNVRDEIEKIKPLDKAAIDKVNVALSVLAEASQQYLKGCLNYLPALKEKDRIAFAELKKGVTGSLTRECLKKEGMCPCNPDQKECWQNCCAEYVNQNYLRCLGDAEMENSKNQKAIQKKISIITDSPPYSRYQEYKGTFSFGGDKDYFIALDKLKGEVGLPEPLPAQPVLAWSYGSPCGGAGDIGITPSTGLKVSLSQYVVAPPLKPGGKVKVTATITGGKPPFKYSWSGAPDGSGESVTYALREIGENTITVDVIDVGNLRGTGKITVTVKGEEGQIQGLPKQVVYGTTADIQVKVDDIKTSETPRTSAGAADTDRKIPSSEELEKVWQSTHSKFNAECVKKYPGNSQEELFKYSECQEAARKEADKARSCAADPERCKGAVSAPEQKPLGKGIRVVWQSDPPITFDPSTSYGATTVLFDRMPANGRIKIWAEIQKETGENVYNTIGKTKEEEVTVVPPKFKWSFVPDKEKGKVGEEVKATITTEPKIDPKLINFEWSYPESSNRMEYETNASVIGFVPKDPKPFMLLVAPKVPYYREFIGGALKEEYQAGAYTVTVTKPYSIGSKPQIWKCDTQLGGAQKCGLVEVENEFAVNQNISMKAEVAPPPQKTPVKYKWDVSPEGCRLHNDITQEITVDCNKTGSYTATVIVRDSDSVELGKGSGQVSITISQEKLTESKKKADEAKKDQKEKEDAQKKLNQAREALRKGKIDEAIKLAEEAAKSDKKLAEPVFKEIARECKKLGGDAIYNRDFTTAVKRLEDAVRLDPSDKEAKDKLAQARRFAGIWTQVEQKAKEFDSLISQKKVWSAHKKMLEIQELQKEMSGGMSNPLSKKVTDDLNQALKEYDDFSQEASRKHAEYFKSEDWEAMLKNAQDMTKRELSPADEKEAKSRLEFAQQKISEQKRIMDFYEITKTEFERGALPDPGKASKELKEKTYAFTQKDPRRQKLLDLADAILKKTTEAQKSIETAKKLRNEGEALQNQGKLKEAIGKYKESLGYVPDKKLEEHIKTLEVKIAQQEQNREAASKLRAEGEQLQNQGKLKEALDKYKQSLGFWPDKKLEEHIKALEVKIAQGEKNQEIASKLRSEGEQLQNQGKLREAVDKYKQSLGYWPDKKLEDYIRTLEERITQEANNKEMAKKLRAEGERLQQQNKLAEAISKYRESLKYWPDPKLQEHIAVLEAKLKEGTENEKRKAQAKKLRDEGYALQQQNRLAEAIAKYKESLSYWPDPELEQYIASLEAKLREQQEQDRRNAIAKKLRDEGNALQQKNRLSEAIAKYRESLTYRPDPELEKYIRELEIRIAKKPPIDMTVPSDTRTPTEKPVKKGSVIFNNGNISGVDNSPSRPTTFTINSPHVITLINNYHWNSGRGAKPGTIGLKHQSGKKYGPWRTKGTPGQGGVQNAGWECYPNVTIPAGTYTVVDSDPKTWAQNSGSQGSGHTKVEGYPVAGEVTQTPVESGSVPTPTPTPTTKPGSSVVAQFENRAGDNVHIFAEGQDTFGPQNKLTPGQRTKVSVKAPVGGGFIKFIAGRNGQKLAECKWEYDPDSSTRMPVVTFSEPNRLGCVTGLR